MAVASGFGMARGFWLGAEACRLRDENAAMCRLHAFE